MRRLKILHIEDSEEDALLFGRACGAAGLQADVHEVRNGSEAVSYLEGDGNFADRNAYPLPDLIVLDLNMPEMNGFDFLRWPRAHAAFLLLPVLVFTRSKSAEDKVRAIAEGATAYFVKPENFEMFVRIAESFRNVVTNGQDKKMSRRLDF